MAAARLYDRVHYRHDPRWLLGDGDNCLCLACVIEMIEDGSVSVVRKKHMLSSFQTFLESKSSTVYTFLGNDGRICAHFVGQMLGMLVNLEDDSALNLITEILVQLILGFKLEQFVHCVLDGCLKELSEVTSMRLCLPILNFLGKLVDAMPSVAEVIATDHCLLKQLLNVDQFVAVIMNVSIWNNDSENTPSLHAQMPLPLVLKKILLSREEFLQIASTQCIAAILVHFPAKYAPSFILADIPEFLFENLLCTSEVLIWSIYCCLILMTEERIFFTKCHTVYGIVAVLKSLKHVLQMNNMELQKQGLFLLTEILKRQPDEIKLFTSTGIFKAAIDVLQEAVNSSILDVAIKATKAVSSFLRKDHLSIPVQYGELEKLLNRMMERCAELSFTSLRRKSSNNQAKMDKNRSISHQGQFLTNVLECFQNACRLALGCKEYNIAHNNAFTAPSSKCKSTLQTFSLYLLNTCDNFCIPIVLRYYEWIAVPATMERFFLLLTDMFALVPYMKESFALKLASASIIRLAMEAKSTLCSVQRNTDLNNACSDFLCHLCIIVWQVKSTNETNSQKEVFDILKKTLIHIEGSVEGFISILLESPNSQNDREVLRCKQQALLIIACVAYLMEDRFISETDLCWTVQSFLHSVQSHGDHVPSYVVRAVLYLLARSQDKCEALNVITVNMVCKMLENVPDIQVAYFHHPLFLKLFFNYPQLMEKYGCLVMKCWIIQDDCKEDESKASIITKLNPSVQWTSMPILSILHSCPDAIVILLDLMNSGSVELANKVLVILKSFLHGKHSFETSNLILNKLLKILQDTRISPDLQEKTLPSILHILCLLQQKSQPKIVLDGSYFKLFYHVNNLSGKCSLCSENILQPALNFLYCSIHHTNSTCKVRATAVILSNTSLIELIEEIMEKTWDRTKSNCSESLCCSAWLMTSTLMSFQQRYNLQVHKTIYVDVNNMVDLISFKFKDTSSMLIVSILQYFKALLRQKFSSSLIHLIKEHRNHPLAEPQDTIWPLTSQSTLYLVAAFQNLLVQKDTVLVRATVDCFGSLLDFLHDKSPDLVLHVASQPWNRFVLILSLTCEANGYLQPGVLRLMALLVKYESFNILTVDEIGKIIDETAHLKIMDLPHAVVLDLQIFLQQLQNKQIPKEAAKKSVIQELLKNINSIPKDSISAPILYVDGTAICLTHLVE
ncbi:meiosis inhibitor protein 1 isoform X2 [Rhinoderma darwinii]|uniref:meiosis inhibitor protein 1 isoform X2 n=1 Tax=Rhinoderma darwinii TaxID=43563 RepID=UPI003F668B0A